MPRRDPRRTLTPSWCGRRPARSASSSLAAVRARIDRESVGIAAGGRGGRRRPSRQHQHAGPGALYVRPDCDGTRHHRDSAGAGRTDNVLTFARRASPFREFVASRRARGAVASRQRRLLAIAMAAPVSSWQSFFSSLNEIVFHSWREPLSPFSFALSAAGCLAGCCYAAFCSATPPGEDDVEAPAAAAPRV